MKDTGIMHIAKKIGKFIDYWYLGVMFLLAPVVIYLNWHAQGMAGLLPNYQQFKTIIQSGFKHTDLITFPMWGYGWFMLITESKLGLLTIQMGLAFTVLYFFIKFLEQEALFSPIFLRVLKISMILSFPWYAFHALRWPYSIAASLFLISLVFFYKAVTHVQNGWFYILLSALSFGLLLNFRSDYLLMPLGFVFLALIFFTTKKTVLQMFVWCLAVYTCLLPWAMYTKKACGYYQLASTNGGHVMFIGLGHNPGNRWGITPDDSDSLMHTLVDEHMQQHNALTCTYEADQFLKQTFFSYITTHPKEYLKKIGYVFCELVLGGCYPGEFFMNEHGEMPLLENTRIRLLLIEIIKNPTFVITCPLDTMRILFTAFSCGVSTLVILFSYLFMPLIVWDVVFRKRSFFMLLVLAVIAYQTLINCFCFHMPSYLGNLYVLYLLQALYGFVLVYEYTGACYRALCRFYKQQ